MASEFDPIELDGTKFSSQKKMSEPPISAGFTDLERRLTNRPPTREELEQKVGETVTKLAELKRAQESLERERAALEEARRRQVEFQSGREEMVQHLTRGIGLLTETEFKARRDADQMLRTLVDLRESLAKVQNINPETWSSDSYGDEVTKALTAIENARMEWNSALLKWPILTEKPAVDETKTSPFQPANATWWRQPFWKLCQLGFALTWPLALVALIALILFCVRLFQK